MTTRSVILIQLRNPIGKDEPVPVLRVFDDVRMLRLKRAFFEDTLCQVAAAGPGDLKIAVAPPARAIWGREAVTNLVARFPRRRAFQTLAERTEVVPQAVAPIEERTTDNLRRCLGNGYDQVILLAGYIPTIRTELISTALRHLRRHSLILGPTIEGGCYLIGLRSDCPEAAELVSIGADTSYKDSTTALAAAGMAWQEIDLSYDVSHQEDLEFIVREINHCRFTGDEETARCTEALLAEFMRDMPGAGDGKGLGT
jgi:hypothetical protein